MGAHAPTPNYEKLSDATDRLIEGDLLLFRGKGLVSSAIRFLTHSDYSHCAMVTWVNGVPFCAEVREWYGGRLVTLASQVEKYPGQIDLYRADPQSLYNGDRRPRAARYMEQLAGCDYSYWSVVKAGLARLPLLRLLLPKLPGTELFNILKWLRDQDTKRAIFKKSPVYCSMAYDMAWNLGAGLDVVKHIDSDFTEPQHLAQSIFFEYQLTFE